MSDALVEQQAQPAGTEDSWSLVQADQNGRPLVIRFRSQPPQGVNRAEFPLLLSATWPYQPNEFGLPSAEEMARMDKFEDALEASFTGSQTAHLMVVLTTGGDRDWLWYTRGEAEAMRQVNLALRGHPHYPVQFSVQSDPTWAAYTQFQSDGCSSSGHSGSLLQWLMAKALQLFG